MWALALLAVGALGGPGVPVAAATGAAAGGPRAARAEVAGPPVLPVSAAALLDAGTGQLLYGDKAQKELPIASTTKLMTALLTLERVPLRTSVVEPPFYFSAVDSQIGLVPGERMSVHDLLLALLLPSADDAAEDLAFHLGGGSVARFIAMMNVRARELGLRHTHYSTAIGLDTPGNYSTAADLVALARYDLATQPFLRRAVALPRARLLSGLHIREIVNRNDLVGRYSWVNGVKTGHTLQAGYVLVGSATRDGMTLISAVLGTPSEAGRDAATLALLRWGLHTFRMRTPARGGAVIARLRVRDRPTLPATVVAASTYRHVFARTVHLRTRAVLPDQLVGPLARGARVGTLLVLADSRVVGRVPLVLADAVAKVVPPGPSLARVVAPITLFCALAVAGAVVIAAGARRQRRRGRAARVRR